MFDARENALLRLLPPAAAVCLLISLFAFPLAGQQTYVPRYDVFAGYAYLNSPKIGLPEHGVHFQIGMRPRTWYSLGFDYSYVRGDLVLTPDLVPDDLAKSLAATLAALAQAGRLPAGYQLRVPAASVTHTFALGPQLAYRHYKWMTLFLRPSIGAIHEIATPQPTDAIAQGIAQKLAPSGKKQDWTGFYGFGGGVDLLFTKHLGLRVQADLVRDHLFNDLLKESRNSVRFSIGPAFQWGRNIAK